MGFGRVHAVRLSSAHAVAVVDIWGITFLVGWFASIFDYAWRRISYLKSHPVVGWEASIMRRGDGRVPVASTAVGRMAGVVCFDADFPEFVRQASQGNADILLVPVNDWLAVKEIHFQMAAFRSIENGMPLVRAAASGLSAALDPWGRVLGISDYFADGDTTMIAQVPMGRVPTPHSKTGDWFPVSCVLATALILAIAIVPYSTYFTGR